MRGLPWLCLIVIAGCGVDEQALCEQGEDPDALMCEFDKGAYEARFRCCDCLITCDATTTTYLECVWSAPQTTEACAQTCFKACPDTEFER